MPLHENIISRVALDRERLVENRFGSQPFESKPVDFLSRHSSCPRRSVNSVTLTRLLLSTIILRCSVKMVGYWPSSFSFFFSLRVYRSELEVHKLSKKERGQYSAIFTKLAWLIRIDLLYGLLENVSCGTQRVVQSGH